MSEAMKKILLLKNNKKQTKKAKTTTTIANPPPRRFCSFATIYLPHFCEPDLEVSLESNDDIDMRTLAISLGKKT